MDLPLRLRLDLDTVKTEHLRRPRADDRADLLSRLQGLEHEAVEAGIPEFVLVAQMRSADILLDQHRPEAAIPILERANAETGLRDSHERRIDLMVHRARAYFQLDDWRAASRVCGDGIRIVEAARSKVSPQGLHSAYLRFKILLYEIGARAAFELGDLEFALQRAELAKCASARRIARGFARDRQGERELRGRYREVCERIDRPGLTDEAQAQLRAKRRAIWDLLSIHRSRGDGNDGSDTVDSHTHAELRADEVLLYYFWTDPRTLLVFAATRTGLTARRVDLSEEDRTLLDRIPNAILEFDRAGGRQRQPTRRHTELLLPAEILAVAGHQPRWLVSAHRNLHLIPFHAMPLDDGYVIDRFSVGYVPNLQAAVARHDLPEHRGVCGVGVRHSHIPGPDGRPLGELANAEDEVESIARSFQAHGMEATAMVGHEASEDHVRALDDTGALAAFSHLHFACHGATIDSDSPLESWLALRDSAFDGLDVAGLHLDAEIVYLSGCCSGQRPVHMPVVGESGQRQELPGDEMFGLPAAFFAAGARQVVSTLWAVDSDTANDVSDAFYKAYLNGESADSALRSAILRYRENAGPFRSGLDMWAPFFLTTLSRPEPPKSRRN